MLTSARETGSCQVLSFGTTQIILADVLSVIPVQTCVLGAQKNRLIGTVRQFFWVPKTSVCCYETKLYVIYAFLSGGLVTFFRVLLLSPRKYCNEDSRPSKLIV